MKKGQNIIDLNELSQKKIISLSH